MRSSFLLFFFLVSTCVGCTVEHLPPPAAPDRELPPLDEPLPAEGDGLSRVVITTDVPARVERLAHVETVGHSGTWRRSVAVGRELLCAQTPCTVSLPYGDHELLFNGLTDRQRTSSAQISLRRASTVVNHTLGQERGNPVRVLGGVAVIAGLVLLTVSAALAVDAEANRRPTPGEAAPLAATGVGALVVGGVVIAITPTKVQEGSTTQWTPTPAFAGATVSAGLKF